MKALFVASVIIFVLVTSTNISLASVDCAPGVTPPNGEICNPIRYSNDNITVAAQKIIAVFTAFFALTALIMVVFSGFRMIISQGNEEQLTTARASLQWAISGLILAMFAYVIISAVANYIGAKNPDPNSYVGDKVVQNPINSPDFLSLLVTMLVGFLQVAGLIAVLMLIVGGFRYLTAAGNEEQAESGKKTLQWAIIGVIVIVLAYVLVRSTLDFLNP